MYSSKLQPGMGKKEYEYDKKGAGQIQELSPKLPSRASYCIIYSFAFNYHQAQATISMLCRSGAQFAHKDAQVMLNTFCTRYGHPLGISKGMSLQMTQFPSSVDMDKILGDRIKNKFKPKIEQMKINFKKVKVEQNHITTDLI